MYVCIFIYLDVCHANQGYGEGHSATYNGRTSDKCPATCALCRVGQADKWPDELLTLGTFDKWQKQHKNEHQTISWLCCDLAIAITRPYSNQGLSCYALAFSSIV